MVFVPTDLPISVATTTQLVQTRTKDNGVIQTAGYASAGDGGGGVYVYHTSGRSGITADSGFYFAGTGGDDYYELRDKTVINVRQFGAIYEKTGNSTTAFAAAATAANTYNSPIYIPEGNYVIDSWRISAPAFIYGDGVEKTILRASSAATGSWIADTGNAAKFTMQSVRLLGQLLDDDGNALAVTDANYASPNVDIALDLGNTSIPWGSGAFLRDIYIQFFWYGIGAKINQNISYINRIWISETGQGMLVTGTGLNISHGQVTGNRGDAYQLAGLITCTVTHASDVNQLNATAHGLVNGDGVYARSAVPSATLPAGLTEHKKYYVVNSTTNAFELSLEVSGDPIDLLDDGSGSFGVTERTSAAVDILGSSKIFDLEIEAPYGHIPCRFSAGSPGQQLQPHINGLFISLNNLRHAFTGTASDNRITLDTAYTSFSTVYYAGRAIYLLGDDLPTGTVENQKYHILDPDDGTDSFQLEETIGGGAVNITVDGTGYLSVTAKPVHLVQWDRPFGSLRNVQVSPGVSGYSNFMTESASIGDPRDVVWDPTSYEGELEATTLVLPNKSDNIIIQGRASGEVKAARIKLSEWTAEFNGTDRRVDLSEIVKLTLPGEYTWAWKAIVSTTNCVMAGSKLSTDSYLAYYSNSTTWIYKSYSPGVGNLLTMTLPTNCDDGNPHVYVLRRQSGNVWTAYQDTNSLSLVETGTLPENYGWIDVVGRMGSAVTPFWFDGTLYYLMAWDRALSDAEMVAAASESFPSDSLLNYQFTDAAGSTVTDFGSGNNHGTYTGTGDLFVAADIPSGYTTFSNLATDRTCDADATSVAELADILGTLIEDLKTQGVINA